MRSIELGIVLPLEEAWTDGSTPRWVEIRELATRAEAMGFDTVWIPDELLWLRDDGPPRGWWEGVAMAGAVAASTSRIKVGTWILSALHRNPGITAKAVETLDEISGGRFVFGLGSGHAGRQAHAFGLPEDHVYRPLRGGGRDHRPAAAGRSRGLRGHLSTPPATWSSDRSVRARAASRS